MPLAFDEIVGDPPEYEFCCNSCSRAAGELLICGRCDGQYGYDDSRSEYYCSDECAGVEDYDSDEGWAYVRNYSYTPYPLEFHALDSEPDEKLFLGVELEVPTDYEGEMAQAIYDGPGRGERLLYCKEDGSISGIEIVTHPMTHKWFSQNFPFGMFADDSEVGRHLRVCRPGEGYGLHVHVSRAGFKSEAHALRWLLLVYRNGKHVGALARRDANEWTSFADADRCAEKAKGGKYGARYVAVNATNDATFEVRVFRSTWSEQEYRAAVDFVHAGVTYTRGINAARAINGVALTWPVFRQWVDMHPEYAALSAEMDRVDDELADNG